MLEISNISWEIAEMSKISKEILEIFKNS